MVCGEQQRFGKMYDSACEGFERILSWLATGWAVIHGRGRCTWNHASLLDLISISMCSFLLIMVALTIMNTSLRSWFAFFWWLVILSIVSLVLGHLFVFFFFYEDCPFRFLVHFLTGPLWAQLLSFSVPYIFWLLIFVGHVVGYYVFPLCS